MTATPHLNTEHPKHNLTGFIIFLCSESVIFLAFFSGFALLKTAALNWLPPVWKASSGVRPCSTRWY